MSTQAPAKMGRPSTFSGEQADSICTHIASGKSLVSWCNANDERPDYCTVMRWLKAHDDFRQNYVQAREDQADYLAEQVVEIADDSSEDLIVDERGNTRLNGEFAQRSKLRVDARKWYAAQMAPKKYGDRIQVDQTTRYENLPEEALASRLAAIQKQIAEASSSGESQHEGGA